MLGLFAKTYVFLPALDNLSEGSHTGRSCVRHSLVWPSQRVEPHKVLFAKRSEGSPPDILFAPDGLLAGLSYWRMFEFS